MDNYSKISENYKQICFNINEAVEKHRKKSDTVEIMAVTKTVPYEYVNEALACGIKLLGENRVQEFLSKKDYYENAAEVHFIGHLQSNKVKYIINNVDMIQSVDSMKLAEEINRLAAINNKVMKVLLEVNIGKEDSKTGFMPENVYDTLQKISEMPNILVNGLMAIPPKDCEEKLFFDMYKLYIDIWSKKLDNINMSVLSMGMSNDYITAIKYGTTLVRIGSKLFGARN